MLAKGQDGKLRQGAVGPFWAGLTRGDGHPAAMPWLGALGGAGVHGQAVHRGLPVAVPGMVAAGRGYLCPSCSGLVLGDMWLPHPLPLPQPLCPAAFSLYSGGDDVPLTRGAACSVFHACPRCPIKSHPPSASGQLISNTLGLHNGGVVVGGMPQECVLGPGTAPARVAGWGAVGVSPVPVPCQVMFAQHVLEGVLFFFFFLPLSFFPFFTSPPKYSASLSSGGGGGGGGRLVCLEELGPFSAPSGCCWAQGG